MINKSITRRLTTALALVAAIGLAAGCSSDASTTAGSGDSSTTTGATDGSSTTAAGATTTLPGATTSSPTATTAATLPATTTTDPADALVLRSDGLGPFDFGSASAAVIDAITAQLGASASNDVVLYVDTAPVGDGNYEGPGPNFNELGFPVGRTVCWTGEFCAEFGGAAEASLGFIGWTYSGPPHMLASSSNLTIGAQWADFPSMVVYATCYVDGGGTHHGINMILAVDGGWDWLVSDGAGGFVQNLPNPEFTRVTYLWAGYFPTNGEGDC